MNTFSTMSAIGKISNQSVISYSKRCILDFSGGTNYIDLSNIVTYSRTAAGVNNTTAIGNATFALVKYNGSHLKSTDLASFTNFTLYLKYATKLSTLPVFNVQYPSKITINKTNINAGETILVQFYSLLPSGTPVPYTITGTVNLNGASLSGTYTAPYQSITYTVTSFTDTVSISIAGGNTVSFSKPLYLVADFDANQNVTIDGNNKVSYWGSTYGSISASPLSTSERPTLTTNYINTYPAIDFNNNGSLSGLLLSNTETTSTAITLVFVMKSLSPVGYNPPLTSYMDWASGALHINAGPNAREIAVNGGGGSIPMTLSTFIPFLLVITIDTLNGNAYNYRFNGESNTSNTKGAGSTVNVNTNFMLGCWKTQSRRFSGGISEFMYYNTVLSITEIQKVEGHLAWKWGLQTNLPSTPLLHPYRNSSVGSGYLF
jgi:hypothetical protein